MQDGQKYNKLLIRSVLIIVFFSGMDEYDKVFLKFQMVFFILREKTKNQIIYKRDHLSILFVFFSFWDIDELSKSY